MGLSQVTYCLSIHEKLKVCVKWPVRRLSYIRYKLVAEFWPLFVIFCALWWLITAQKSFAPSVNQRHSEGPRTVVFCWRSMVYWLSTIYLQTGCRLAAEGHQPKIDVQLLPAKTKDQPPTSYLLTKFCTTITTPMATTITTTTSSITNTTTTSIYTIDTTSNTTFTASMYHYYYYLIAVCFCRRISTTRGNRCHMRINWVFFNMQ